MLLKLQLTVRLIRVRHRPKPWLRQIDFMLAKVSNWTSWPTRLANLKVHCSTRKTIPRKCPEPFQPRMPSFFDLASLLSSRFPSENDSRMPKNQVCQTKLASLDMPFRTCVAAIAGPNAGPNAGPRRPQSAPHLRPRPVPKSAFANRLLINHYLTENEALSSHLLILLKYLCHTIRAAIGTRITLFSAPKIFKHTPLVGVPRLSLPRAHMPRQRAKTKAPEPGIADHPSQVRRPRTAQQLVPRAAGPAGFSPRRRRSSAHGYRSNVQLHI
jgi:hypothetical protein